MLTERAINRRENREINKSSSRDDPGTGGRFGVTFDASYVGLKHPQPSIDGKCVKSNCDLYVDKNRAARIRKSPNSLHPARYTVAVQPHIPLGGKRRNKTRYITELIAKCRRQ